MRQPVPKTLAMAQDLMALANSGSDPAKLAVAHRALGYSLFIAGELREAKRFLPKALPLPTPSWIASSQSMASIQAWCVEFMEDRPKF